MENFPLTMNKASNIKPLFTKVDCIRLSVNDLQEGIDFYHDKLGLPIIWKTDTAIGLEIPGTVTEIVMHTESMPLEVDFKVNSVSEAIKRIEEAGGKILTGPFDIAIGKCAVIQDPWKNEFVVLDTSKGTFVVDEKNDVIGLKE